MHSIRMTNKDSKRLKVLALIERGLMTREAGADLLEISVRQVDRLRVKSVKEGPIGIIHKARGKKSNRALDGAYEARVIQIVKESYADFGPTLAREKLRERNSLSISKEKLRQLMIRTGLWKVRRKKDVRCHPRRPRRSCLGDLLQGDASHHDWFETGNRCVLVAFIDDATNRSYGRFYESETAEAYMDLLRRYLAKYGKPLALYVDKDSIFRVNRIEVKSGSLETQFGRMLKDLEMRLICAHSPQAKGRIERLFGILQDRLIKEMRLRGIRDMETANAFLESEYWESHNKRWNVNSEAQNVHRESPSSNDLDRIFTFRECRKVSKSLDFRYNGTTYQVDTKTPFRLAGKSITIFKRTDGTFWTEHDGKALLIKPFKDVADPVCIVDSKQLDSFLNKKPPLTVIQRSRRGIQVPR